MTKVELIEKMAKDAKMMVNANESTMRRIGRVIIILQFNRNGETVNCMNFNIEF